MESFLQFLLNASKSSSESAMLAAENRARNKMKKAKELLEEAAEDLADARLAAMLLDLRKRGAALHGSKKTPDLPSVPGADAALLDSLHQGGNGNVNKGRKFAPGQVSVQPELNQPVEYRGRVRIIHER